MLFFESDLLLEKSSIKKLTCQVFFGIFKSMSKHEPPSFRTPSSFVTFRLAKLQGSLNTQATAILKEKAGLSLVEWRLIQISTHVQKCVNA